MTGAGALAAVFGPTRSQGRLLWLGSAKSNIGHTQAAAGALSIIKVAMSLMHERLPKTLHAETPSEHIVWDGSGLQLLQQAQPWSRNSGRVRRAGVSGFGFSGTNAHVVLEAAPPRSSRKSAKRQKADRPFVLPISARDDASLRDYVESYRRALEDASLDLADFCYSAGA